MRPRWSPRWWFLGLGLGLLACAPRPSVQLTFLFRGELPETEMLVATVSEFEASHPGIRVVLERGNHYNERMLNPRLPAPDVCFVEQNDLRTYCRQGLLLDLSPFMAADRKFSLATYYPQVLERFAYEGRPYALARDAAPLCCIYYNRDLFRAAGLADPQDDWRWPDDFLPVAAKLTRRSADGQTVCWGFSDEWPAWETFLYSNGGQPLDDPARPTRILLDAPECLQALEFRRDLRLKYGVQPGPDQILAAGAPDARALFIQGKLGMLLAGFWETPILRDNCRFDWDVVMFPQGPAGPRRFTCGGSGYGISPATRHPQEAWALVKYLAGAPGQKILARAGLAQPADRTIAESPDFLDPRRAPRNRRIMLRAMADARFPPTWERWDEFVGGYWMPGLAELWEGKPGAAQKLRAEVARANIELFRRPRAGGD